MIFYTVRAYLASIIHKAIYCERRGPFLALFYIIVDEVQNTRHFSKLFAVGIILRGKLKHFERQT